jgi:hypothetical protein
MALANQGSLTGNGTRCGSCVLGGEFLPFEVNRGLSPLALTRGVGNDRPVWQLEHIPLPELVS